MKTIVFFLSCIIGFCQLPGSLRSPISISQYRTYGTGDVYALTPTMWIRAGDGVTTGIDGSRVSVWADQSGNGNDLSWSSSVVNQPYFYENVINGHPAVRFWATNAMVLTNRFPASIGLPIEIFTVFMNIYSNQSLGVGEIYNGVDNSQHDYHLYVGAGTLYGGTFFGEATIDYDYTKWCVVHVGAYTNKTVFLRTFNRKYKWKTFSDYNGLPGFRFGYYSATGGRWFNGYVAEMILINRHLTEDQAQGVSLYLCKKYNLPLNN